MEILLYVIFALLGLAFGSFLNVCIDRLPAGKSLAFPPSHCDACGQKLKPVDLVPVVSYLRLRGRCRYCGAHIPSRVLWVELGAGVLFALFFWRFGLTLDFAINVIYASLFLLIAIIDLEQQLILNKIVYPAAFVALLVALLLQRPGVVSSLIGGGIGFVFLLVPALINPRGMGFGDVKMAALIGLIVGFPLVFVALIIGIVLGGLVAVFLLALRLKKRKEAIPFGPFLSIGTIVTLLWGQSILDWYVRFFR